MLLTDRSGGQQAAHPASPKPAIAPIVVRVVGIGVIFVVALVTYSPIMRMGFGSEDEYTYLFWAASMSLPQYVLHALDPHQVINYRPIFRMLILIEYGLFHSEGNFYHLVQILLHGGDALLVMVIVVRLGYSWRAAILSGVLFAALPVASEAVFLIEDQSPLVTLFCLIMVLFWVEYLRHGGRFWYSGTLLTLALALLSKETAVVFPLVLFLIDRVLIRGPIRLDGLIMRYMPFSVLFLAYLFLEYQAQAQGAFFMEGGASLGPHVWSNYQGYWALLAFPWGPVAPFFDSLAPVVVSLLFVVIATLRKSTLFVLALVLVLLAIGPTVLYNLGVYARYLYLPAVPVVMLWSLGVEALGRQAKSAFLSVLPLVAITALVMSGSFHVADSAAAKTEEARRNRAPFRDILQQNPTFPQGTRLFFIEPPSAPPFIAGLFRLRYGGAVSVAGTVRDGQLWLGGRLSPEKAALDDYPTAYVYYFDDTNRPIRVGVDPMAKTQASPALPQDFEMPIELEGYEVTADRLRRGQELALVLYWRALGTVPKDYTVFVHLVSRDGQIVGGVDEMPRGGKERTSTWRANHLAADAHVIRVPEDAPLGGNYQLEVGLYELTSMQRVLLADRYGASSIDAILIGPLSVVEDAANQ